MKYLPDGSAGHAGTNIISALVKKAVQLWPYQPHHFQCLCRQSESAKRVIVVQEITLSGDEANKRSNSGVSS